MYYELFQEDPLVFFLIALISLAVTLLAYSAFPVLYARVRKNTITKKKYNLHCYLFNFLVMVVFIIFNGESSGGPYFLWTWVFARSGLKKLEERGILEGSQHIQSPVGHVEKKSAVVSPPVQVQPDHCKQCGKVLLGEAMYCAVCGTKVEKTPAAPVKDKVPEPMLNVEAGEDPIKKIMEMQAQQTINAMEANRDHQPDNEADPEFGLVPDKPIFTLATEIVQGERNYLNRLQIANGGGKITWKRTGSIGIEGIEGMIDIYDTFTPAGELYKTIYINMYGARASTAAPAGFEFISAQPHVLVPLYECNPDNTISREQLKAAAMSIKRSYTETLQVINVDRRRKGLPPLRLKEDMVIEPSSKPVSTPVQSYTVREVNRPSRSRGWILGVVLGLIAVAVLFFGINYVQFNSALNEREFLRAQQHLKMIPFGETLFADKSNYLKAGCILRRRTAAGAVTNGRRAV